MAFVWVASVLSCWSASMYATSGFCRSCSTALSDIRAENPSIAAPKRSTPRAPSPRAWVYGVGRLGAAGATLQDDDPAAVDRRGLRGAEQRGPAVRVGRRLGGAGAGRERTEDEDRGRGGGGSRTAAQVARPE